MRTITTTELRSLLLSIKGTTTVSVVSCTEPALKAKDSEKNPNPFMRGAKLADGFTLRKVTKANGPIGADYVARTEKRYADQINTERAANGQEPLTGENLESAVNDLFVRGTSWHRPILIGGKPSCLCVNKKTDDFGPAYLTFFYNSVGTPDFVDLDTGDTVDRAKIAPFESEKSENIAKIVTFSLDSIAEIAIGGERYRIVDNLLSLSGKTREKVEGIANEYLTGDRKMTKI